MKKLIALLVPFVLLLSLLSGCGVSRDTMPDQSLPDTAPSAQTESTSEITATIPTSLLTEPTVPVPQNSSLEIHYIDVGQADAALVLCDGEAMLIDGGDPEDSRLIYAYLQAHNVDHLDVIIATHGHSDHIGGLSGALNYATVDTAYCSVASYDSDAFRSFTKYLATQGKTITVPSPGDTFMLGSATATILGPVAFSDEPNNMSIVLMLEYGNTRFLFTGDAELEEETDILDAGYIIDCDVLKVGHHGSRNSTNYRWLREAAPEYAVISVGTDNSYGHPSEYLLSRLRDAGVTVYRTDMQGSIICTSDGNTVSFTVERNASVDTLNDAGTGGDHHSDATVQTEMDGVPDCDDVITYVCNTNTHKFHYPDCSSVDAMADKNKLEVTLSREDVIAQGYSPCGRCKP